MNDTKWDELRLAMHSIEPLPPAWRAKDAESGYLSAWDRDWFYHFRLGGYRTIEWIEIKVDSVEQDRTVLGMLRMIHVPGTRTEHGFMILGQASRGSVVDYL
jgi:hypothetical protein